MKYVLKNKFKRALVYVLDTAGYALKRAGEVQSPIGFSKNADFHSILLIRMDHIGDVLSASAAPKLIKQNDPHARLYFLTSSWAAPLLEGNPFIDELIIYDAPWFSRCKYVKNGPKGLGFFQLARVLRQKKIELGLAFRGDLRENFLMAIAGIRHRVGTGITGGGFMLTHEVSYRSGDHETRRLANILKIAGISAGNLSTQLYFTDEEKADFNKRLAEWGVDLNKPLIGFQAEAGTPAKNWPAEHAASFLEGLIQQFPDFQVLLLGAASKNFLLKKLKSPRIIDLTGRTSLKDLMLLTGFLKFFVGPDSGPAHIACAGGVRTVFLYSGTNVFEEWKPLSENTVVLRREVPCAPCNRTHCNVPGHPCMSRITPQSVLEILGNEIKNL